MDYSRCETPGHRHRPLSLLSLREYTAAFFCENKVKHRDWVVHAVRNRSMEGGVFRVEHHYC